MWEGLVVAVIVPCVVAALVWGAARAKSWREDRATARVREAEWVRQWEVLCRTVLDEGASTQLAPLFRQDPEVELGLSGLRGREIPDWLKDKVRPVTLARLQAEPLQSNVRRMLRLVAALAVEYACPTGFRPAGRGSVSRHAVLKPKWGIGKSMGDGVFATVTAGVSVDLLDKAGQIVTHQVQVTLDFYLTRTQVHSLTTHWGVETGASEITAFLRSAVALSPWSRWGITTASG